ncbi:MAG: hypothetical protein BGN87_13000 [Rhizobiales bacterium 65-79]|nr:MAG: hypothetical protein BGN87_13000 [Rhizobiales bacterium 65-79]
MARRCSQHRIRDCFSRRVTRKPRQVNLNGRDAVFAKKLNLCFVAEMCHRNLNEEIVAQRTNIQVGDYLLRVGVFEPEEFGFDLLARLRHDFALIERGALR